MKKNKSNQGATAQTGTRSTDYEIFRQMFDDLELYDSRRILSAMAKAFMISMSYEDALTLDEKASAIAGYELVEKLFNYNDLVNELD